MTDIHTKQQYRQLVADLKEMAKTKGSRMTNEDIASFLGYDRSYFSSLLGERGKVTEQHIKELKLHFPTLEGAGYTQPDSPPSQVQEPDVQTKYVRLLESNQKLEEKFTMLASNLAELPRNLTSLTDLILHSQKEVAQKLGMEMVTRLDAIGQKLDSIASSQKVAAGKKQVHKGK
jgi:hypothetical protein